MTGVPPQPAGRRLASQRQVVSARLERLRADHAGILAASVDSNADDEHDPEGATIAFERQQVVALVKQAEKQLAELDAALSRLDAAAYGLCEHCGLPIPPERLAVRPSASRCVPCAS